MTLGSRCFPHGTPKLIWSLQLAKSEGVQQRCQLHLAFPFKATHMSSSFPLKAQEKAKGPRHTHINNIFIMFHIYIYIYIYMQYLADVYKYSVFLCTDRLLHISLYMDMFKHVNRVVKQRSPDLRRPGTPLAHRTGTRPSRR